MDLATQIERVKHIGQLLGEHGTRQAEADEEAVNAVLKALEDHEKGSGKCIHGEPLIGFCDFCGRIYGAAG
jgi:hypothetical protein